MTLVASKEAISLKTGAQVSDFKEITIGAEGLLKKILQKGISWQTPIPGDEVQVHYSVRLKDGDVFDSSRDRGIPFTFKLGQCEVIKGWDEGIATMRKGERSMFTIPAELGYGEKGCPPQIPPNSTLIFDVELISWFPIREISGDGGILKKIIREGEGWATPNHQDEVLVKYVARNENGNIVSQSDEGLEFSLTDGHLCPAMAKAVKTMRKREEAELLVKFSHGLRHCKNEMLKVDGDTVSPYSNLIIRVELISWRSVVDIDGHKKILKKLMETGEGFDRPNEGSRVKVTYIGKLENGTIFERKGSDAEPFEYICAREQINKDLDRAIMTMKKGEVAVVKISSDEASSIYEIKLIDFIKEKPFWKMDIRERIIACGRKKNEGNLLFRDGKFELASRKYEEGSKLIEYNHSFNHEEQQEANSLGVLCYLNNAACKLKLGEYVEVMRLCTKVLEVEPFNVKALFRRSQAYMNTSELDKAEEDIKNVLALDPNNKDVWMVYKKLKEKQRQYGRQESRIYSTMISRITD
ncbi:70 kDa peptidyl-prolyl isomerase-like [Primulina eburnea]|uniref:70 kDa peptidyl-prolyl isomerase-like n=1 Tax=Primulina eburnea TaxID=1245227 RepID=UPI003C6BD8AA